MKIGADEIILHLRKNHLSDKVSNEVLGKKIAEIIRNLGGELLEKDVPVQWGHEKNVGRENLPKTAAQYEIAEEKLGIIYQKLKEYPW